MKKITYIFVLVLFIIILSAPAIVRASAVDFNLISHEHRPHIPSPLKQSDVAAGVAISTIGIVIVNTLTKTSIFGNASFNGSFDPTSTRPGGQSPSAGTGGSQAPSGPGASQAPPVSGSMGTSASTGAGASASSVVPTPQTSASMSGSGTGGGLMGVIKDFFRHLFLNIRDMLTDEGRSYASGKLSELLDSVIPEDINKK